LTVGICDEFWLKTGSVRLVATGAFNVACGLVDFDDTMVYVLLSNATWLVPCLLRSLAELPHINQPTGFSLLFIPKIYVSPGVYASAFLAGPGSCEPCHGICLI
jgi:hypothetical protein